MSLFKKTKPFISYRVYLQVGEGDAESPKYYGMEWDNEYKTWYLDGHKYNDSVIAKDERIKRLFTPFRAHGQHQYFI